MRIPLDIAVPLTFLFPALAAGQTFNDLGFEQACDGCKSGMAHWAISWETPGARCGSDGPPGARALLISGEGPDDVGFVEQSAAVEDTTVSRILSVSVSIRSEQVQGGRGAGIYITGLDGAGNVAFSKDLGFGSFKWVLGTQAAKRHGLKVVRPPGVATVRIGFILYGAGRVWFDDVEVASEPLDGRAFGPEGTAYVDAACDTIRRHSLHRDSIDLPVLRATALRIAGDRNDPQDHHLAVGYLLQALGDGHSFLMEPEVVRAWEGDGTGGTVIEQPTHRIINGRGYIAVPHFPSRDALLMHAFADSIQQALRRMEAAGAKGWIVDLRNNTGGNMTPMVAGLGPLFYAGTLGRLVDVDGGSQQWSYADGVYAWDGVEELRVEHPVTLTQPRPIAVLVGGRTGSSGECVTISFIGNSHTRLFGAPTWGLTTGNGEFDLPDGAKMFLASTVMADRHGNPFHGPIEPDEHVEQPADWSYDSALDAALKWLETQP